MKCRDGTRSHTWARAPDIPTSGTNSWAKTNFKAAKAHPVSGPVGVQVGAWFVKMDDRSTCLGVTSFLQVRRAVQRKYLLCGRSAPTAGPPVALGPPPDYVRVTLCLAQHVRRDLNVNVSTLARTGLFIRSAGYVVLRRHFAVLSQPARDQQGVYLWCHQHWGRPSMCTESALLRPRRLLYSGMSVVLGTFGVMCACAPTRAQRRMLYLHLLMSGLVLGIGLDPVVSAAQACIAECDTCTIASASAAQLALESAQPPWGTRHFCGSGPSQSC